MGVGQFYWWRKLEYLEKNHRPVTSHWQTLSHNIVSSTPLPDAIRSHKVSGDRHWLQVVINQTTIRSRLVRPPCPTRRDRIYFMSLYSGVHFKARYIYIYVGVVLKTQSHAYMLNIFMMFLMSQYNTDRRQYSSKNEAKLTIRRSWHDEKYCKCKQR